MEQFSRTRLASFPMLNNLLHPEFFLDFSSMISFHLRVIFAMDLDGVLYAGADDIVDTISRLHFHALHTARSNKPDSTIVLSFRILQNQRFEVLQEELLQLAAKAEAIKALKASNVSSNHDEQLNA
jgi:hypothetical protein